jgi:ABC-type nitrate/sulfonate/bicarbonate transport system permease component
MRAPTKVKGETSRASVEQSALVQSWRDRQTTRLRNALPLIVTVAVVILIWEFFGRITGEPDYVLPPLHKILVTAVDRSLDKLLPATWITLREILAGFALGAFVGFSLGVAIFHIQTLRQALMPLIIATQAVPVLAIAPILVIWFGFGMEPKIIVAALIVFFPVTINTIAGLGTVERDLINLMNSLDATPRQIFFKVRFPAALPSIFTGLKNAAVISVIGAIVGEWVGSDAGLGPVMIAANSAFKTDLVFAAILYLATIGVALFLAVSLAERRLIAWHFLMRGARE